MKQPNIKRIFNSRLFWAVGAAERKKIQTVVSMIVIAISVQFEQLKAVKHSQNTTIIHISNAFKNF